MKRLIINADDFGMSQSVTDAIIDCHLNGVVTSTTIMANMPFVEYAAQRAKSECPNLSVGIHLNLTEGKSILAPEKVYMLLDEQGNFTNSIQQCKKLWYGKEIKKQIFIELKAQVEKAKQLGLEITHFDSHHGIQKRPLVRQVLLELAEIYKIPSARTHKGLYWCSSNAGLNIKLKVFVNNLKNMHRKLMKDYNHFILSKTLVLPDGMLQPNMLLPYITDRKLLLIKCLEEMKKGTYELIVHPGYRDVNTNDTLEYQKIRESEVLSLLDINVKKIFKDNSIDLISFKDLTT